MTAIAPLNYIEKTLTVRDLFVDPRIQRELVTRQLNSMQDDNYRTESIGTLVVSARPGGQYAILDGQHRWTVVCQQDPERPLKCQVFSGLTFEQEAELFLLYNNQSSVNALAKFKAGVMAGRPLPVAVNAILDKYGLEVGNGFHFFSAVFTAMKIITWRDGEHLLDRAVDIITRAWAPIEYRDSGALSLENMRGNGPWRGATIEGMARLIHRYGDKLNADRMVEQLMMLGSRGPQRVANDAATTKASWGGLTTAEATAMLLVKIYNNGRGGPKLDNWTMDYDDNLGGMGHNTTLSDLINRDDRPTPEATESD